MTSLSQLIASADPTVEMSIARSNGLFRAEHVFGAPVVDRIWGTVYTVTPDMAREILRFMSGNRPPSKQHAAKLAKILRDGKFVVTHQGIAFDEHGILIDGQHRLTACVDTCRPITVFVVFNVPRSSFTALDRPRVRNSAQDVLIGGRVANIKEGNSLIAVARILKAWDEGRDPGVKDPGQQADTGTLLETVAGHPLVGDTSRWVDANRGNKLMPPAPFAAFLTLFREADDDRAMRFARQLVIGANLDEDAPAFLLRKATEKTKSERVGADETRALFCRRVVHAWNLYSAGKKLQRLPLGAERDFPTIAGHPADPHAAPKAA